VPDEELAVKNEIPPYFFEDPILRCKNIGWRVEEGVWDTHNPLMTPEYPWDSATSFSEGTVLKDPIDGLWKAWAGSYPHIEDFTVGQFDRRITYATSEDGVNWIKPQLDGFPCMGHEKSNVLLGLEDVGRAGLVTVLVHPEAEEDKRYEMFLHAYPPYKNPSKHARGFPVRPEHKDAHPSGIWRYFSRDGIHWNPFEGPLDLETGDSIFIVKEKDGPYVAYSKIGRTAAPGAFFPYDIGAGEQRILVRRESEDGSHWSPYEIIIEPDWRDAHSTQLMDMGTVRQGNGIVAIVAIYNALDQRMDLQFAGSPDGKKWFRPFPRAGCLRNRPLGDCGGGLFYGAPYIIEDGDKLHYYFGALEGLHGDLYGKTSGEFLQYGGLCRATWEKGRLWSMVPGAGGPTEGSFFTYPLENSEGRELIINAMTIGDGQIEAEIVNPAWDGSAGETVPGFSRNEFIVFQGDEKTYVLKWKEGSKLPGKGTMLQLFMRRARLYGYEIR